MFIGVIISLALFFGLIAGLEGGRRMGRRFRRQAADEGGGSADGVLYAVLGLLIAFTFTSAASRFDERRRLIVQQANALGTAWLRVDILQPEHQPEIRKRMRRWVELVCQTQQLAGDPAQFMAMVEESERLQQEVWQLTIKAVEDHPKPPLAAQTLPPLNDWIDLTSTRLAMNTMDPPPAVLQTIIVLSLAGSVLAGFALSKSPKRSVLHMIAFAGAISLCIYVIQDLNHPRAGLLRVDATDQAMLDLKESMKADPTTRPAP